MNDQSIEQHCGQPMCYEATTDGATFDGQKLTGTFYCERCSAMRPTYAAAPVDSGTEVEAEGGEAWPLYSGDLWLDKDGTANFKFHIEGGDFPAASLALRKFILCLKDKLDRAEECPYSERTMNHCVHCGKEFLYSYESDTCPPCFSIAQATVPVEAKAELGDAAQNDSGRAGKGLAVLTTEQAAEAPDSVSGQPPQQRGWELISEERERQQTREGWNADHDDEHENGELALAANCYRKIGLGSHGHNTPEADQSEATEPDEWPWGPQWWKPKTRLRNLVRAGALYQAEIDRLCRVRMQVTEEIDALLASKPDAETA